MSILHILNGDSARLGLEKSGVPGTFVAWPDLLYEGPTPLLFGRDWIAVRSAYFVSSGYGPTDETYRGPEASDTQFEGHEELVFWFEHDLYDQLLLIRCLWWLHGHRRGGSPIAQARLSLVCIDKYLGLLEPQAFPPLFAARAQIDDRLIRAGAEAWTAFCGSDPTRLVPLATTPSIELPFLPGALWRHLEEFPSVENGLSRSEARILEILSTGEHSPEQLFSALQHTEERIFMGDLSCWVIVRRLAAGPHPLVTFDVAERPGRLPTGRVRIADDGRRVLAGERDYVALNGIDRWLGGVHLTPAACWRWDGSRMLNAEC